MSTRGRPRHKPTDESRKSVYSMSAHGVSQEIISKVLNIDDNTLRKYYSYELDTANALRCNEVAENLFQKALGDGNSSVAAAIFWLKTRGRWREERDAENEIAGTMRFVVQNDPDAS